MAFGQSDAKKKVLDELMGYLDQKDGAELGDVVKPKGVGLEVAKVEGLGDESDPAQVGEETAPGLDADAGQSGEPKLSDEELSELIEALQSKLGG